MRVVPGIRDWIAPIAFTGASLRGRVRSISPRGERFLFAAVVGDTAEAVFEFGAGIGTITYFLLSATPKLSVVAVEEDKFCLAQLAQNIPGTSLSQD